MSKNTRTSPQAKHASRRVASLASVLLHASVLFVVALCPCATPGFGLVNLTESEAPVDQDESSEEVAISAQARTRVVCNQPGLPLLIPVRDDLALATARLAGVPHSGHRLSNNLLAPLRC